MYKAVDLCAGIGGIRLGFEQAFGDDIRTVYAAEIDKFARQTYEANFKNTHHQYIFDTDFTDNRIGWIPRHDILLAGFPCQAFSIAGKKKGFEDARGQLIWHILRTVEAYRPKVLFFENVKNLVHLHNGEEFKAIVDRIEKYGYKVYWKVLNAKYFHVPQNRERLYIVCFRDFDLDVKPFEFPEESEPDKIVADILIEDQEKKWLSENYVNFIERYNEHQNEMGSGFERKWLSRYSIAPTVCKSTGSRDRLLLIDYRADEDGCMYRWYRKLSGRELARLQGFPDDFQLPCSYYQTAGQLGNSVAVPVIKAIAEKIKESLDE